MTESILVALSPWHNQSRTVPVKRQFRTGAELLAGSTPSPTMLRPLLLLSKATPTATQPPSNLGRGAHICVRTRPPYTSACLTSSRGTQRSCVSSPTNRTGAPLGRAPLYGRRCNARPGPQRCADELRSRQTTVADVSVPLVQCSPNVTHLSSFVADQTHTRAPT